MNLKNKDSKFITRKLDNMEVGDSITYSYLQRGSVETTRGRYQKSKNGLGKKFKIDTVDDFTFTVTRKI